VKLVFLGTPRVAVPALEALLGAGHEVRLVVTQPDRPAGRSRDPLPPPVKKLAIERGIEVFQPAKVRNAAYREKLAACEPEALVVVAYGRILPGKVLRIAPLGSVNVHFSLLPKYRGAAPVQWTLVNGEEVTGVTTMLMNEKMDEGDILLQREIPIVEGEHSPALSDRLSRIGSELLVETIARLASGAIEPRPQDHSAATLAPMIAKEDGEVSPDLTAKAIEGRIRGFDPWPGVWLRRGRRRLRIVDARAADLPPHEEPPGTIAELTSDGLLMACGEGSSLLLAAIQPEGRKVLTARDAVNGRQLQVGDRLEQARSA
jgi:methionyl-tRNA formyltransferase